MNYDEAVAWLYATQLHGIHLGLENIQRLTNALGIRVAAPEAPKFLHVAGTNGKGSVCAMLDACCRSAGLKTGLFTSPHLVSLEERFRVEGVPISRPELAQLVVALTDGGDGLDSTGAQNQRVLQVAERVPHGAQAQAHTRLGSRKRYSGTGCVRGRRARWLPSLPCSRTTCTLPHAQSSLCEVVCVRAYLHVDG